MEKFVRKQSCLDDSEITPSKKLKPEEIEGKEEAVDAEEDDFSDPIPWQKIESEGLDCDYALLFTKHEADHLFQKLEKEVVYSTGESHLSILKV